MVRYPTIVIGMVTLGASAMSTSALVRMVGDYMMQWRVRELALGGEVMRCNRPMPPRPNAGRHAGAIRIDDVVKIYDPDGAAVMAVDHCSLDIARRRDLHDRRPVGLRQDDAAERDRRLPRASRRRASYIDGKLLCGPDKPMAEPGSGPHRRVPERRAVPVEDAISRTSPSAR